MSLSVNEDQLIEIVAQKVADEVIDNERLISRAVTMLEDRVNQLFTEVVDQQIRDKAAEITRDAFDRSYRRVDGFGRPAGEETTIAKELGWMISEYWSQAVDKSGKPTEKNSYTKSMSRAEWTMLQICSGDFQGELKQHAVNVTASLKDGLRARLRQEVDQALSSLFRVVSHDDKEEGRRNG